MSDPMRQIESELDRLRALRDRTLVILGQEGAGLAEKLRQIEIVFQEERDLDGEAEEARDRERLS